MNIILLLRGWFTERVISDVQMLLTKPEIVESRFRLHSGRVKGHRVQWEGDTVKNNCLNRLNFLLWV
ncbi:MAG: hypothetical protein KIT39_00745 [Nitrospirales bacterium]|nr:hypothetical protein [Nitrospirales bacterium]